MGGGPTEMGRPQSAPGDGIVVFAQRRGGVGSALQGGQELFGQRIRFLLEAAAAQAGQPEEGLIQPDGPPPVAVQGRGGMVGGQRGEGKMGAEPGRVHQRVANPLGLAPGGDAGPQGDPGLRNRGAHVRFVPGAPDLSRVYAKPVLNIETLVSHW